MKQRRQLAALTLSAAMLISMTACGQGTQPSTSSVPSSSSQPSASQSSSASVPSSPEGESDYPLNNQGGIAAAEGSDIGTAATTLSTRDASGYNGAVTSGKQEASEVGIEVLKAGGNAIDACVATALAIGFFEPNASGLGGGGFMNIYLADEQKNVAISSQFPAPEDIPLDYFEYLLNEDGTRNQELWSEFNSSGKAVSIMKALSTYQVALDNWGTMTLSEIIPYVTQAAEQGIRVTENLHNLIDSSYEKLYMHEASRELWLKDGLTVPEVGDVIYNPDLIDTLNLIAENGIEYFYEGPIAQEIVDIIQADGGVMNMNDLKTAMTDVLVIDDPVEVTYRGYKLYSMPLPSSGGVIVGEILNILENFDLASMGHNTPESIHVISEAMMRACADRGAYLGDPSFGDIPITGLSSKDYAYSLYEQITDEATTELEAGDPMPYESASTTHMSVIDKDGNMACMTQSISSHFGCGITVPGRGFLLSNGLTSFDLEQGKPNSVAPGKLSLSSMTPTILVSPEGEPVLISGSPGGERIIACMAQTIINIVDFGMNAQDSADAPRVFAGADCVIQVEGRMPQDVIDELEAMGHTVKVGSDWDANMGSSNTITYNPDTGELHVAGDPRRDSQGVAY